MLSRLHTHGVGPASEMQLDFGPRLNVMTGDNGLGKSVVLDLVWWVLTGRWANGIAIPSGDEPRMGYQATNGRASARFSRGEQRWRFDTAHGRAPLGSVVYLGSERLASFVQYRNHFPAAFGDDTLRDRPPAFVFEGRELWDGKHDEHNRPLCNGLIHDWVNWMRSRPHRGQGATDGLPAPFDLLEQVLAILSPGDGVALTAGTPRRVTVDDSREIPTLHTPWEPKPVPVTLASAGVRRILELTYALVWTWCEHRQLAALTQQPPATKLFVLVDEPETHLHPRWQRTILPALVAVATALTPELDVQLFVTTHSPVVLASVETIFEHDRDRLFHFTARDDDVIVEQLDWVKHGDASGWLRSSALGLEGAGRSVEAARAIGWADALMLGRLEEIPEPLRSRDALTAELRRVLAGDDEYWTYWYLPEGDVAE